MSVAFFPGQGSQFVGMGKELHENFSAFRDIFEEASDAISLNLKKLCFDGPDSDLTLTRNTQPALLATSFGVFKVAQTEFGYEPKLVMGHSLGEYTALVANGSIRLADAIRWVRFRGEAMQSAVPKGEGTMAAVLGMKDNDVEEICILATERAKQARGHLNPPPTIESIVTPANFNAPGQVVIAGSNDAIDIALEMIANGEGPIPAGKAKKLAVSAPFHSPLMRPARDQMASLFERSEIKPAQMKCPYIPNVTARRTQESTVIYEMLTQQVDHPVLWTQSIENMLSSGDHTHGIEFGPGKVIQGLNKRIVKNAGKEFETRSIHSLSDIKEFEK